MKNKIELLVAQFGYGIIVKSDNPDLLPFRVVKPIGKKFYEVEVIGKSKKAHVLRNMIVEMDNEP